MVHLGKRGRKMHKAKKKKMENLRIEIEFACNCSQAVFSYLLQSVLPVNALIF
jgi:hypothetical protein